MVFKNLMKEDVKVDKKAFLEAINAQKPMAVTHEGEILFGRPDDLPAKPYVYVGQPASLTGTAGTPPTPLKKILGENYEVKDEGETVAIYAGRAWQELLAANEPYALYLDTTADGIAEFNDEVLEDLVWYSCEFGINYREIAEHLEKHCDGLILCVENEVPYNFNGAVFVDDIQKAREEAKRFMVDTLQSRIKKGAVDIHNLTPEEREALAYFGLI